MAMTTVPRWFFPAYLPVPNMMLTNAQPQEVDLVNGTSVQRCAFVFVAPEDGEIDGVEFSVSSVSAPSEVKFSFQDVDASTGFPDGVVDQFGVISGLTAGWQSCILTADGTSGGTRRTVSRGDVIAWVGEWNSTQSGSVTFRGNYTDGSPQMGSHAHYWARHNGTSWSKSFFLSTSIFPCLCLRYVGGSYPRIEAPITPITGMSLTSFNNGSTPDEYALRLQVPLSARARGCWVIGRWLAPADVVLYDGSHVALATVSYDPDVSNDDAWKSKYFTFPAALTLDANATYRLAVKPSSASDVQVFSSSVSANAVLESMLGGVQCYLSTRTDGGSWTDTLTVVPHMGLILDGIDSGGGGTTVRPIIGGGPGQRGVGVF